MEYRKDHLTNICLALIVASATVLLSGSPFFQRLELLSLDTFFHLRGKPEAPSKDIIIVEIASDEIQQIGRWPWERTWLTRMVNTLKSFGARELLFDFLMSAKSQDAIDAGFEQALEQAGNVYLPSYWKINENNEREILKPIERFARYIKGTGFVNIIADVDGTYRKIPLFSKEEDGTYYNVLIQIVMDRLGLTVKSLALDQMVLSGPQGTWTIPLVEGNSMLINWYGPWRDSFRMYSFLDILQAHDDVTQGKTPAIDIAPIKDSITIVAVTAAGLYDVKPVPLHPHYPGAGILASSLSNVLDQSFIRTAPVWVNLLFIYLIALFPPFFILQERPIKEILNIAAGVVCFLLMYILFLNGYKMALSTPLVALLGSYVVVTTYNFTTSKALLKKIEQEQQANLQLKKKYEDLEGDLTMTAKEKEDLEKVNKELGRFVHTVSHDIRSPLMGVLGYADLLRNRFKGKLDKNEKSFMNGIFESVDHLNTMIDDLLKTTKISRVRQPYERTNSKEIVDAIVKRLDFEIKKTGTELTIEPNLPVIYCDRIKMGEVFHNLITNAVKFSSKNNTTPKIAVTCRDAGDFAEFCVQDNGIGIDPKDHHAIFEMRHRTGEAQEYSGTGIGLNLVKLIIDDHGGRVWVESAPEAGAAFYFTLPKKLPHKSS